MYDKSLEQLIDAVIADGVITPQERKVVYKKAADFGIDQDEIKVYLDGRLHAHNVSANKGTSKHGAMRICPNCGASINSFETNCIECGFEFKNTMGVDSMERFFRKLNSTHDIEKKCELIKTFPIPNDKESLFEFLSVSIPNSRDARGAFSKGFSRWFMIGCIVLILFSISYILFEYHPAGLLLIGAPASLISAIILSCVGSKNSVAEAWEIKTEAALNKLKIIGHNNQEIKLETKIAAKDYYADRTRNIIVYCIEMALAIFIAFIAFVPKSSMEEVRGYVTAGNYEQAEICVDKIIGRQDSSWDKYDTYSEFLNLCVVNMCENKEFEKASVFIHTKQGKLRGFSSYRDENKNTIGNLERIISEYQGVPYIVTEEDSKKIE